MDALRAALLSMIFAFAVPSFAQTGDGDGVRGSTPPGQSHDGAAPGDGAIKGGSIVPGETSGQPNESTQPVTSEALKRCYELSGTLRDQCLLQERGASTGGTSDVPAKPADPSVRDPVSAPPPQNPR
jgi:hypothetical protein